LDVGLTTASTVQAALQISAETSRSIAVIFTGEREAASKVSRLAKRFVVLCVDPALDKGLWESLGAPSHNSIVFYDSAGSVLKIVTNHLEVLPAEPAVPERRLKHMRRLKPEVGKVIHGAGQTLRDYIEYYNGIGTSKPSMRMVYVGLIEDPPFWAADTFPRQKMLPTSAAIQVGLDLGRGERTLERVTSGELDLHIASLARTLQVRGVPIFLRIGYEFNAPWSGGYEPATYKEAWIRIAKLLELLNQ